MSSAINSTKLLRWAVTLGVIILFSVYFVNHTDKFQPLLDINPWWLFIIGAGNVVLFISNGLATKIILKPFQKYLSLIETSYIALVTSVGNFFAPVGTGLAIRAVYLKRKHQVPYTDYLSILAGNYLIVLLVNSVLGLAALFLLRSRADTNYQIALAAFVAVSLVSLWFMRFNIRISSINRIKSQKLQYLAAMVAKVGEGWKRIRQNKNLLLQLISITTFNTFLVVGITWAIVNSLNLSAGFATLLLLSVVSSLSLFLNITPANLGVKEALYIFLGTVLGFSVEQIILIAIVDRGVSFLMMFASYMALRLKGVEFKKPAD